MNQSVRISRRRFHALAGSALAMTATSVFAQQPEQESIASNASGMLPTPKTIKCLNCDLNWARFGDNTRSALASDWATVDPQEYFDFHREIGNNMIFLQAFTQGGFAFYPTKLGPMATGEGSQLLPRLWELSRKAKMPFMSFMSANYEHGPDGVWNRHPEWVIPGTQIFTAPESGWTDLLCERIREFLKQFPVEWMHFDGFSYGGLLTDFHVRPAPFVEKPFQEIIGRPMPAEAAEITPEESLKYKREVMARQFRAIRKAIKETSPGTQMGFNVPYWKADDPMWQDHPMVNESESLITECTTTDIMEWALRGRKPGQRILTTLFGRPDGSTDPNTWRRWYAEGCDFFIYVWGTPPDFRPLPCYNEGLKIVREAFREIP